ncbi:MAG: hypothetical protein WC558_13320 [Patulibacter sp.]
MFSKMKAVMATTAAAGLLAIAGASAADAATIAPGGSFTGSAGASRLVVTSGTGIPLNCTTSTGAASITAGTFTPPATVGTITPAFSSCIGPSGFAFTVTCSAANLWLTGSPVAGTTAGELRNINCLVTFNALACSGRITGTVQGSYTNPVGTTAARLTILAAGQSLTTSASTCPAAILPNGAAADFGAPGAGSTGIANLTYVLGGSGTTHPVVS